ncbi:hypothetical protein [Catellatospora tritici]|uniref:hypothetical protein n=1 Tax=Catellatospora tritici TaxID=2851566 RepID=UPI001C2D26B8|nr:hypothetical protein [Catellatospora tritici]MBV1849203.1 hypothetical protein [Catellatospora tritici]
MLLWALMLRLVGLGSSGSDLWRDLGTAPIVAAAVAMVTWTRGRVRARLPAAAVGLSALFGLDVAGHAMVGRENFGPGWPALTLGMP